MYFWFFRREMSGGKMESWEIKQMSQWEEREIRKNAFKILLEFWEIMIGGCYN